MTSPPNMLLGISHPEKISSYTERSNSKGRNCLGARYGLCYHSLVVADLVYQTVDISSWGTDSLKCNCRSTPQAPYPGGDILACRYERT